MVVGDLLCALNLASSVLVNGACCFYQMHEEEERRKEHEAAVQRAIRNELDIHRHQEMMRRHHERQVGSIVSRYQEERRRKLMTQKSGFSNGARSTCQEHAAMDETKNDHESRDESASILLSGKNLYDPTISIYNETGNTDSNSIASTFTRYSSFDPKAGVSLHPTTSKMFGERRDICIGTGGSLLHLKSGGELSSLFDDLEDDDFEEIEIE